MKVDWPSFPLIMFHICGRNSLDQAGVTKLGILESWRKLIALQDLIGQVSLSFSWYYTATYSRTLWKMSWALMFISRNNYGDHLLYRVANDTTTLRVSAAQRSGQNWIFLVTNDFWELFLVHLEHLDKKIQILDFTRAALDTTTIPPHMPLCQWQDEIDFTRQKTWWIDCCSVAASHSLRLKFFG